MRLLGGVPTKLLRSRGVLLMAVLSVSSALSIALGGLFSLLPLIAFGVAVLACQVGIAGVILVSVAWKVSTITRNLSGTSSKQLGAIQKLSSSLVTKLREMEWAPPATNVPAGGGDEDRVISGDVASPTEVAKDAGIPLPRIGRSAAAVAAQEDGAERLLRALESGPPTIAPSKRPVLVLGTPLLHRMLDTDYQVLKARSGLLSAMFNASHPTAVIVEQQAFVEGPWFGGLAASGTMMYQEVAALLNMARSQGVPTYLVPSDMPNDIFTSDLKLLTDLVIGEPHDVSDYGSDVRFPLIEVLGGYLDGLEVSSFSKTAIGAEV